MASNIFPLRRYSLYRYSIVGFLKKGSMALELFCSIKMGNDGRKRYVLYNYIWKSLELNLVYLDKVASAIKNIEMTSLQNFSIAYDTSIL